MLRITQSRNAEGAIAYFNNGLSQSDYYAEKGEVIGDWGGHAAQRLGLSGPVEKEAFAALCYNRKPSGKEKLTSRNDANRTVGYDFTFSAPKSVSIIYSQTKDMEILDAMNEAVQETMLEIEGESETRVRVDGKQENRQTGNLLWGTFTHEESRPVGGIPDPHLHQHVFVFNATFDEAESKWKAAQFRNTKANAPYYEALFHANLAQRLTEKGYSIDRNARDFEIAGFERTTIEKFSNRTKEINEKASALRLAFEEDKAQLGAKTRKKKDTSFDREAVMDVWASRLTDEEATLIATAKNTAPSEKGDTVMTTHQQAKEIVEFAIEHGLERKSVIGQKELMTYALKRSMGSVTKADLEQAIIDHENIISRTTKMGLVYTTEGAIKEEEELTKESKDGIGEYEAINPDFEPENQELTDEQKQAVSHVLESKDLITIVTGRAGTGKTWSVKEIAKGVAAAGLPFGAFAPSADASRKVQRQDGFENATTIAELLLSEKCQQKIQGGLIWIDEAGMVGTKTMNKIINLAKEQNARILLTGDTRQHKAVERGDALEIMKKFGGITPAYISKIQRQQKEAYKGAVEAISEGRIAEGYKALDDMDAIKEAKDFDQLTENVASEYVEAIKEKEAALVVATTHAQGKTVTASIRDKLKEEKLLGSDEKTFTIQKNLSLTEQQKQDIVNYEVGHSIQFHQHAPGGFKRGSKHEVVGKDKEGNILVKQMHGDEASKITALPLDATKHYSVYQQEEIGLAKGDKIKITKNGFSNEKRRLNNGDIVTITGFNEDGDVIAATAKTRITLDKNFGNFTHGYYTTSPSSQGKSVSRVIVMQGSHSGKAASQEQFYVSVSRGKFAVSIHTDDKEFMLYSVQQSSARQTATEVFGDPEHQDELQTDFNQAAEQDVDNTPDMRSEWQQASNTPDVEDLEELEEEIEEKFEPDDFSL